MSLRDTLKPRKDVAIIPPFVKGGGGDFAPREKLFKTVRGEGKWKEWHNRLGFLYFFYFPDQAQSGPGNLFLGKSLGLIELALLAIAVGCDAFTAGMGVGARFCDPRQIFRLSFHFGLESACSICSCKP